MPSIAAFSFVRETSTTQGTADYVLSGAIAGFVAFGDVVQSGTQIFYTARDGQYSETGVGIYRFVNGQHILERAEIIQNNIGSTAKINWGPGVREVYCAIPGSRIATLDGPNVFQIGQIKFSAPGKRIITLVYGSGSEWGIYDHTAGAWIAYWDWGPYGLRLRIPQKVVADEVDAQTLKQNGNQIGTAAYRAAHTPITSTVVSATTATITLDNTASTQDGAYVGFKLRITSGPLSGQSRRITAYAGSSRTATLHAALPSAPSAGTVVQISSGPERNQALVGLDASGRIDRDLLPVFLGASAGTDGAIGAVPIPVAGQQTALLRGDGTWVEPVSIFTGAWSTFSNGSTITQTHSLGAYPDQYFAELQNQTAEYGYSPGMRVVLASSAEGGAGRGIAVSATDTQLRAIIGSNGISILRADSYGVATINPANWRIRLVGVRWTWRD